MPAIKEGESRNDFVSRCVPILIGEGKEKDEAVAICNSMYEKKEMKLETVDIDKWIEVFKVGKWNGHDFKEKDLDEMLDNYKKGIIEPYLTLDHNPGLTKATKDFFKAMSLGNISDLKKEGKSIFAKFKQVPKLIAELINSGSLKQRSVEWWTRFKDASGKIYNNVLEGITFHGANGIPAISTLADIPALFKEQSDKTKSIESGNLLVIELKNEEVKNMSDITIDKKEYQDLLENKVSLERFKLDVNSKDKEIAMLKDENEKINKENIELKSKEETLIKLKAEIEADKKEILKAEAEKYIDEIIKAKKKLPKFKDFLVNQYITLKANENEFKMFKDDLESGSEVINMGELTGGLEDSKVNLKSINRQFSSEKEVAEDNEEYMDDIDEAIKKQMKLKGYGEDKYMQAGYEIGVFTESEITSQGGN